jgi:hypothetical protein
MRTDHILVLHIFGVTIRIESNCADVLSSIEQEWAGWRTGYATDGRTSIVRVTRYREELEFCHVRHRYLTQEARIAWPCRKCVGDIFFDGSPLKHFVCYTPDVAAIVSEVGWIISHVIHWHLDPSVIAMHASAVVDPAGNGVMFVGRSDAGKSTLASLMVAGGWRLVANETTYVTFGDSIHISGIPSRIDLASSSIELVRALSGSDPAATEFAFGPDGPSFSEVEGDLRLIVLPALTPDRRLRIADSAGDHALTQLGLRRIDYAIYPESQSPPANWALALCDRVPVWTVEGRLDSLEAPDRIARMARGQF